MISRANCSATRPFSAELGENLIKATSAKEALEKLLKTDVAVVLMDVSMPEIDGFELAEMIRQHPRFQKTAIIFVSAVHLTDLDRLKGYQHGAVDYLSVPIVPEVLRAKVRVFAELHRKNRQLERLNSELEQRVAERTQELEQKRLRCSNSTATWRRRTRNWTRSCTPLPISFSAGNADGARDYISGRFYEYTGAAAGFRGRIRLAGISASRRQGAKPGALAACVQSGERL